MGYATYPSFFVFQGGLPSLRLPCSNCLQLAVYTSGPIAPSKPSSAGPQSYPLPLSYRAIHHQRPVRAQLPPPRLRWTDGRMSCQLESPSCSRRRRSVPSTPGKTKSGLLLFALVDDGLRIRYIQYGYPVSSAIIEFNALCTYSQCIPYTSALPNTSSPTLGSPLKIYASHCSPYPPA